MYAECLVDDDELMHDLDVSVMFCLNLDCQLTDRLSSSMQMAWLMTTR